MQHLSCVAPYGAWIPNEHPGWFLIALIPASWGTREALPMAHAAGEEQPCPEPWALLQCRTGWAQLQDCPTAWQGTAQQAQSSGTAVI